MKRNHRIVTAAGVGLGAAAAGLCALSGCGAPRDRDVTIHDDSQARLTEARRLAAEGQAAQVAGTPGRAIELYQKSLAATRELGFVQNNLGLLLMDRDNYLEAVALFQEAADVIPESAKPLYNIGLAYSRRGWDEKAMGYFEKALAREPSDRDTLRAAVMSAKRLDVADEASLGRVRRVLMLETDPRWKRMQESEQFRIEGALVRAKENAPLAVPQDMPVGATDRALDPAAPGPVADPSPVRAPGPVTPARRSNPAPAPLPDSPAPAPMSPVAPAPVPAPAPAPQPPATQPGR